MKIYSVIVGSGSYIPTVVVKNEDFLKNEFYDSSGIKFDIPNEEIISKFEKITGIKERRHVTDDLVTSKISTFAAEDALESSGIDKETLDYIIVAHNFGDVHKGTTIPDFVPSIAARVKRNLGIENPFTVAFDIPFGCPGWVQGSILADYYLKSGDAKRVLVIGSDTLSRISDPYDRDSMIYADGAGAVIFEAVESDKPVGILSHLTRSDTLNHAKLMWMAESFNKDYKEKDLFIKMNGHRLYDYALTNVPPLVKATIDKAGLTLKDINKVFIHQANDKMDVEMLKRLFKLYNEPVVNFDVMPMTISWLGNSSVATVPTIYDLVVKGRMEGHKFDKGDYAVFVSVGAGMNINAFAYKEI